MFRRVGCCLVVLFFAFGLFVLASCGTIRAGLLVRDALKSPAELAPHVKESRLSYDAAGERLEMRVYRPLDADGPCPGIVLVHGAVVDGANDPRFIALAQAMAKRGGTVATPDLRSLRDFRLDRNDPARVVAAARALADRVDLVRDGKVAIVGISVGGSYGLLASLDDRLSGRVTAILTFGAYSDLDWLLRRWMTDPKSDAPELLDPQTTGRRLVLRGNLGVLVEPGERDSVREIIDRLLDGRPAGEVPEGLSPAARRVVAVAISEGPVDPAVVSKLLEPLEADIAALSPALRSGAPAAPVYLLHGESDPIVPVADLETLREHLESRGAKVSVHVTDIFSHVKRMGEGTPTLFSAWPFLSFLAGFLSDAGY
jgi:dienelactone hydrolase